MIKQNKQILIKPIDIENLCIKKHLAGKTKICSKDGRFKTIARIYLCPNSRFDDEMETKCELYKVVIRKKHVVGYCLLYKEGSCLNVPLLGSIDSHYHIGHILSQILIDRMFDLNCDRIELIASWNSILHHYHNGYFPCDQLKVNAAKCDYSLAQNNMREILKLGCLPMYLPTNILEEKYNSFSEKILDLSKIAAGESRVGKTTLFNHHSRTTESVTVYRNDCDTEAEIYTLCRPAARGRKKLVLGNIVLNYFYWKDGKFISNFGTYPEWSVFSRYGKEHFLDKTFAEYWSICNNDCFDETEIVNILFQIALEAGRYYDCPRLQIEADWDEHSAMYEYGFRTQPFDCPKKADEICKIIETEAQQKSSINLNKLGSIEMFLDKKNVNDQIRKQRVLYSKCRIDCNKRRGLHKNRR